MKKRIFLCLLSVFLLCGSSYAVENEDILHWVDFQVDHRALQEALNIDIASQGEEKPLSWIDILALTATYTGGGNFPVSQIRKSAELLRGDQSPQELLGKQYKYYAYYHRAYTAVLAGLVPHGLPRCGLGHLDRRPACALCIFRIRHESKPLMKEYQAMRDLLPKLKGEMTRTGNDIFDFMD